MILGDFGYGFVIVLLALWLRTLPFAKDLWVRMPQLSSFGWVFGVCSGDSCSLKDSDSFGMNHGRLWKDSTWTKDLTYGFKSSDIGTALGLGHTYVPFHRADGAHRLRSLSVYVGVLHLFLGFVIGFFNVLKGHGICAPSSKRVAG